MSLKVDQKHAQAGEDIVGRDKYVTINQDVKVSPKGIEGLLVSLKEQIENKQSAREVIEELARYHSRRSVDGIDGLEAKLEAGNLSHRYLDAIEKKERFAKLLEKMSLYSSAQKIFAIFLSKVENEFSHVVHPQVPSLSEAELNQLIIDRIINPICDQCDADVLLISYDTVYGMVYWLAEQCFIRWHE